MRSQRGNGPNAALRLCAMLVCTRALFACGSAPEDDPIARKQSAAVLDPPAAFASTAQPSQPEPAARDPEPEPEPRAGAGGDVVSEADVAGWAQRTGAREGAVKLEAISVYGAAPGGERPAAEREVRIVLRFDGVAVYRRGELAAGGGLPRRLVLDLDGATIAPSVGSVVPVAAGGLERVRVVPLDDGQTRVAFDVGPTTAYRLFFLSEPYRVVMDFHNEAPRAASARPRPFRIVVDPGHGGEQPGAKGPNGLRESAVALSIARRVQKSLLRQLPGVRVALTRNDDRLVSLEERAAIANAVDADLFVSIHLNASPSPEDEGGVSTFVLDTTNDQAALRLAARENGTGTEGVTQLQFVLATLYRNDQVERSLAAAEDVQRAVLRGGRRVLPDLKDRGVKRALFYVLVGAQMPALLVEASFITRPEEAAALATDPYRQALADGIAEGVAQYVEREGRQARK